MSSHSARVPAPLRVLVIADDEHIVDPTRIIAAIGHGVDVAIGVCAPDDECSTATLLAAANALEGLDRGGVRARYLELPGPLAHGIAAWAERDATDHAERLVLVDAAVGPRRIRQLRRALRSAGGHLGVVPALRSEGVAAS